MESNDHRSVNAARDLRAAVSFTRVGILFGCAAAAIGCVRNSTVSGSGDGGLDGGRPDGADGTALDAVVPDAADDSIGNSVKDADSGIPWTAWTSDASCEVDGAPDLCLVAGSLTGLRWELPCTAPGTSLSCRCPLKQVQTTTLLGTQGRRYDINLRFRGVVEEKTYVAPASRDAVGAEADGGANAALFIAGGAPPNDGFNVYRLDISDPQQTFYLNAGASGSPSVSLIDYDVVISMKGGATVTLTADSLDGLENYNSGPDGGPVLVPDVPPAPQTYDGQFVQMDVQSVISVR